MWVGLLMFSGHRSYGTVPEVQTSGPSGSMTLRQKPVSVCLQQGNELADTQEGFVFLAFRRRELAFGAFFDQGLDALPAVRGPPGGAARLRRWADPGIH